MDRVTSGSAHRPQFGVEVHRRESGAVVTPRGELDHHSVDLLKEAIDSCISESRYPIVIDCAGLGFCDSTGLNTLLAARMEIEEAGGEVHLAAMSPAVSRVFEITGADAVFPMHETLEAALAAIEAG
ncbi:STAS domain-containing protein [Streptomyces calidiresistens]|uniref:Anti-sigma factor antagonist n=1 Tax=Streptomyces calidiresistens TaxID=1485586 RepID=A0A7W3XY50_9ACTN|nr:STAS domain-containing protein [Streptomyces calidiresistens]MBB0231456.1 anti-sigma factor antagonist [Streptomyces calidiresistens]